MRFGIPAYRLPRDVLDAEVSRILDLGIDLELDTRWMTSCRRCPKVSTRCSWRSVPISANVPTSRPASRLMSWTPSRCCAEWKEERPLLGRRVVVYGGGNTAMDAARTARRLGAEEAIVVYRRTRDRMPAHDMEVADALEEGVIMRWLSTIRHGDAHEMVVERMELDDTGFPQPTGETETLAADSWSWLWDRTLTCHCSTQSRPRDQRRCRGGRRPDDDGPPGVFAGGDMVPNERTVTVAVGHGKQAARCIDGWLRGQQFDHPARPPLAAFDSLNTWYYTDAPKTGAAPPRRGPTAELLRRGHRWSGRVDGPVRGQTLSVVWQLFPLRQLLRRVSGQRRS